jgi:hypothetical protein
MKGESGSQGFIAVQGETVADHLSCSCLFCVAKYLLGSTQTLKLHPVDAGLASPNEKVYGSNTLSAIGKQLFQSKKKIAMIKDEHCRKM